MASPAEHDARTHHKHVVNEVGRQVPKGGWNHDAGMGAKHQALVDVTGVAAVAGGRVRTEAEVVVVVGDGDDARTWRSSLDASPSVKAGGGDVDE
jgi:hypothetical protein